MKKKFYLTLFCALCLSALLLGLSYAKESGTNKETFLNITKNENFKIVTSSTEISTDNELGTDISVVNKSNKDTVVIISLQRKLTEDEEDNKEYDIYYSINDSEVKKLIDNEINLGTLKKYGAPGDQTTYNIKLTSKSESPIYYTFEINKEEYKTIDEVIRSSESTYEDENHSIRFYGTNVKNYIKYENNIYRIVGIVNNKVKLTTNVLDESDYWTAKNNNELLNIEDYLRSFTNYRIEETNAKSHSSWLKEQQFWLNDEKNDGAYVASAKLGIYVDAYTKPHNNRYVTIIEPNYYVINGDGTISNPYEVAYDR